jgi:hypothetical protein
MMGVQVDRKLLPQDRVGADRLLEQLLLHIAREVWPEPKRGVADDLLEPWRVVAHGSFPSLMADPDCSVRSGGRNIGIRSKVSAQGKILQSFATEQHVFRTTILSTQ